MKKAMIVQPMNGLGEEQILEARAKAVAELERRGYEVVDTYFKDGLAVPPKVVNVPLYYLSQSLDKMAECDAVYLCDGWENARGCKVERAAAVAYDLELIGYDLLRAGQRVEPAARLLRRRSERAVEPGGRAGLRRLRPLHRGMLRLRHLRA